MRERRYLEWVQVKEQENDKEVNEGKISGESTNKSNNVCVKKVKIVRIENKDQKHRNDNVINIVIVLETQ